MSAKIMTMTLTTKYPVNANVDVSNLTFGPTKCFTSMPFVENPNGVIIPNTTGTQEEMGYRFSSVEKEWTLKRYLILALKSGSKESDRLIESAHSTRAKVPKIW